MPTPTAQQAANTYTGQGAAPPSTGDPAIDAAIQQFIASGGAQGVDTSAANPYANPTSYVDPTLPVYTGTYTPVYAPKIGGKWGLTGNGPEIAGPALPGTGTPKSSTSTVNDLLKSFYDMSPDDLSRTQRLLFAGGFYGNGVHLTDVPFGTPDESSFAAWARAVSRAARLYGAGKQITVDQVLAQAARAGGITADATTGKDKVVNLTDPASLRLTIDNTAQSILGRKATPDEERVFVSLIHQAQTGAQLALENTNNPYAGGVNDGGAGTGTATQPTAYNVTTGPNGQPDVQLSDLQQAQQQQQQPGATVFSTSPAADAQAAEYLRTQNPEEAGAHDIAMQFFNFTKALRGPAG